jgi:hypothetical protein
MTCACLALVVPPRRTSAAHMEQNSDAVLRCTLVMVQREGEDKRLVKDVQGQLLPSTLAVLLHAISCVSLCAHTKLDLAHGTAGHAQRAERQPTKGQPSCKYCMVACPPAFASQGATHACNASPIHTRTDCCWGWGTPGPNQARGFPALCTSGPSTTIDSRARLSTTSRMMTTKTEVVVETTTPAGYARCHLPIVASLNQPWLP